MRDKTETEQQYHANMLRDCRDILNKYNVTAILTGSALLGAYRDGDIIPWSRGAVFSCFRSELVKHEKKIIQDLKDAGFTVTRHFKKLNYKIRVDKADCNIEILGYSKDGELYYRKLQNKKKVVPEFFFSEPLSEIELRGETYTAPRDIEGYLSFVYSDWQTLIRSWKPKNYKNPDHMVNDK